MHPGSGFEGDIFEMGVAEEKKTFADDAPAPLIDFVDLVAEKSHAKALDVIDTPVVVSHLASRRFHPVEVFDVHAMYGVSLEKATTEEDRLGLSQAHEVANKFELFLLSGGKIPVQP